MGLRESFGVSTEGLSGAKGAKKRRQSGERGAEAGGGGEGAARAIVTEREAERSKKMGKAPR